MQPDPDLAALFAETKQNPIEWHGPLYSLVDLPHECSKLEVRFVDYVDNPPQGLRLKIRGGRMNVAGQALADVVLWRDSAPPTVNVAIEWSARARRSFSVWNVWRVNNVTQAWLGNAGIRVEERAHGLLLRCSDGNGPLDFRALTVEIGID